MTHRYFNGKPLVAAHRFKSMFDFGFVALDILYAYPEDNGVYTVVASNELGEARCECQLIVHGKKAMQTDSQHPQSMRRVFVALSYSSQASTVFARWRRRATLVASRTSIIGRRVRLNSSAVCVNSNCAKDRIFTWN
jgi:hypothetical protein